MKLSDKLALVTDELLKELPKRQRKPEFINKGFCNIWAMLLKAIHPSIVIYITTTHSFVRIGNKFYDATTIRGVKKIENLTDFKNGNLVYHRLPIEITDCIILPDYHIGMYQHILNKIKDKL